MQIVLHIDDEIREKDLHGHGKQAERREGQIERRVLFRNSRAEPVDKVFQIAVPSRLQLRLRDQEDGHNARQNNESAEDREEFLPLPALCHAVEQAKNDEHGNERQNGQHGFCLAPRRVRHGVGDPRVERRVVGRRAEKRHDAVEHDDHHRRGSRRRGRREQLRRVFDCHEAERRRRKAPEQIAAADKQLALSHAVGQRAHQQRRQCGGSRAPADHGGDIAGVGGDGIIKVDIKIHIFDRPGKLADHADKNERQPDARGQLFHIRHPPVIQHLRCRSISYRAQYGPQYRTRLSTRSPSRRSRFCHPGWFPRSRSSSSPLRYNPSWRL